MIDLRCTSCLAQAHRLSFIDGDRLCDACWEADPEIAALLAPDTEVGR